jgi:phosphonate transport system substrate-binding protein
VLLGLAAAGGGVKRTLEQQPDNIRNNLEVIYQTAGVASHPFVVHPRVPVAIQKKVQQALLDFADTNRGKAILNEVPFQQLGRASYDDYKPIATLGLEQFFVQE